MTRYIKIGLIACLAYYTITASVAAQELKTQPVESLAENTGIRPWAENPWYWSYHGEPVMLLGGSDDDNLFQWLEDDLVAQLDRLAACGGNVIRNTMSDRHDKGFEIYPFKQLGDGRYDLNQWNDEYWSRFERMLNETAKRGIVVQIEIWDRFDYVDQSDSRWQIHPYNPKNNINYSYQESGFAERYPDHPGRNRQPFFFTTPKQRNNQTVLQFQQRFVDNMLEHTLRYDHVLYCMDNETSGEAAWGRYWAQYVKGRAAERGKKVCVTEMWDDWNLQGAEHRQTLDHPELYDFVDVSQNNHNKGQEHWDNFLFVRRYLANQPRPMNTTKTYGADGNKFKHTDQDAIERFWRHLLAGAASIRFHRPDSGLGLNDKAVRCIIAARLALKQVPIWTVDPHQELLADCDENQAYLAAQPGKAYLVYFPARTDQGRSRVLLDLNGVGGQFQVQWINIDTGKPGETLRTAGGKPIELSPPEAANWAAVLCR